MVHGDDSGECVLECGSLCFSPPVLCLVVSLSLSLSLSLSVLCVCVCFCVCL